MAIYLGNSTPEKFYLGSAEVEKIYLGSSEIWSASNAPFWFKLTANEMQTAINQLLNLGTKYSDLTKYAIFAVPITTFSGGVDGCAIFLYRPSPQNNARITKINGTISAPYQSYLIQANIWGEISELRFNNSTKQFTTAKNRVDLSSETSFDGYLSSTPAILSSNEWYLFLDGDITLTFV